jgi:hypothetical protein
MRKHLAMMVPMRVRFVWSPRKFRIAAIVLCVLILVGLALATDWFDWRLVPNPTPNRY